MEAMRKTQILSLIVAVGFVAPSFGQDVYGFERVSLPGVVPLVLGDVVFADMNGDGRHDLITMGYDATSTPRFMLYDNNGNGVFSPRETSVADAANGSIDVGDVDNDGDLDLLLTGEYYPDGASLLVELTRVYLNDGADFSLAFDAPVGFRRGEAKFFDAEHDGDLDFAVVGGNDSARGARVAVNDGEGNFSWTGPDSGYTYELDYASLEIVDMDFDGFEDILVFGYRSGRPQYQDRSGAYLRKSDPLRAGSFVEAATNISLLYSHGDIQAIPATPFFGDRYLMTGINAAGDYVARGMQNVWTGHIFYKPVAYSDAALGDYNFDDVVDLALMGDTAAQGDAIVMIYESARGDDNINDTTYYPPTYEWTGARNGAVAWADIDGDGDLDLFVMGAAQTNGEAVTTAYYRRNDYDLEQGIPRPSAPTELQASSSAHANSIVTLSWTHSSGYGTNPTYNIAVGTSPDAFDVVSPEADPATGARLVSRGGNAGAAMRRTLTHLAPGTYYWRAQTISPAFAASEFSPVDSFVVEETTLDLDATFFAKPFAMNEFVVVLSTRQTLPSAPTAKLVPGGSITLVSIDGPNVTRGEFRLRASGDYGLATTYRLLDGTALTDTIRFHYAEATGDEATGDEATSVELADGAALRNARFERAGSALGYANGDETVFRLNGELRAPATIVLPIDPDRFAPDDRVALYHRSGDNGGERLGGGAASDGFVSATTTRGGSFFVDADDDPPETPGRFRLKNNYPNPFNPSTTVEFELPERATVELIVYNALGERVAVLFDGAAEAGVHSPRFDARDLPAGVYFYRLHARGESGERFGDVGKMTLLK